MRRPSLTLASMAIVPLLGLAVAASAMASTAAAAAPMRAASQLRTGTTAAAATRSAVAGFVHWDPNTGPTATYSSAGQGVTVTKDTTGVEIIDFPGIASARNAQVSVPSSFATSPNASCNVESFISIPINNPTTLSVEVDCFDNTGASADEPFDLLVTNPATRPAGVLDFDLVPANLIGLNTTFKSAQFNSSGKRNSVAHPSTGEYAVTMPGAGSKGNRQGTVKVSLSSDQPGGCQIGSWTATKAAQKITVVCFDPTGAPQDMPFLVTYVRGNNLMGRSGLTDANATVLAGGSVYQPATQFDSARGAKITAAHLDRGRYLVFFAGSSPTGAANGGDGNIQVTPIGTAYRHCGYDLRRTHTPKLDVTCTNASGTPVDTGFTVQWVVA